MPARWEVALDAQLDTFKSVSSGEGRGYVERFARSAMRDSPWTDGPGSMFRDLPDRLGAMLFNADPIWVEPDMMTVFEHAVPGFKGEPLQPTDLVTPAGFLLLPRPIRVPDIHGKDVCYRAVLWHPQEMVLRGPVEEVLKNTPEPVTVKHNGASIPVEKKGHEFTAQGILVALFHDPSDKDDYSDPAERRYGGLLLSHVMPWSYGARWGLDDADDPRSIIRPTQCLWRLMSQSLAAHSKERASAPFRKRWARGWKAPEKAVVVVRLRRTYADKDNNEPHPVDWQVRWIVRGHWRWAYYPSEDRHKQIWVHAYPKGPPDKPLKMRKATAFELVR